VRAPKRRKTKATSEKIRLSLVGVFARLAMVKQTKKRIQRMVG
jgi:uncharacterized protein YhhL (DUF1145 family)